MAQYRIVESEGKFYPEVRLRWLFLRWWQPIEGRVCIRGVYFQGSNFRHTLTRKDAEERINDYERKRLWRIQKKADKKPDIIHNYTPK